MPLFCSPHCSSECLNTIPSLPFLGDPMSKQYWKDQKGLQESLENLLSDHDAPTPGQVFFHNFCYYLPVSIEQGNMFGYFKKDEGLAGQLTGFFCDRIFFLLPNFTHLSIIRG